MSTFLDVGDLSLNFADDALPKLLLACHSFVASFGYVNYLKCYNKITFFWQFSHYIPLGAPTHSPSHQITPLPLYCRNLECDPFSLLRYSPHGKAKWITKVLWTAQHCCMISAYLTVGVDCMVYSHYFWCYLVIHTHSFSLKLVKEFLVVFGIFLQGLWCSMWRNLDTVFVPSPLMLIPYPATMLVVLQLGRGLTPHIYCYNSTHYIKSAGGASVLILFCILERGD